MTAKPVRPRAVARQDVDDAFDYYLTEAGADIALRFVEDLQRTYNSISTRPAIGSPRYAHELRLPGLRSRGLKRFPYLVFYVERTDDIDVWRVLHTSRDIPSWLVEQDGSH